MATLETDLLLPLDPLSVRRARHHVVDTLRRAGHEDWADDAALAVTEIVSNVVIHACTACEVSVRVMDASVRVAVRDFNPVLPLGRHFSQYATTGRGLSLVAGVSSDYGVDALGPDGKVVWFVVDSENTDVESDPPVPEWDLDDLLDQDAAAHAPPTSVLARVPMAMWLAGLEHWTAVLRELYLLIAAGQHPPANASVDLAGAGAALRLLSEATEHALGEAAAKPWLARLPSLPEGRPSALAEIPAEYDIGIAVGTAGAAAFGALQDCLDYGRKLGAEGQLLVRPALDEIVALRDWACEQVIAQSMGVPPTPWDRARSNLATAGGVLAPAPEWDDTAVRTSRRAVIAADDSNRLIALSQAAAQLLGGTVEELVGRRITSIVPPRLREQHVTGFTRHLTTGHARALGVELDLPVLCLDGREVVRRFLIEQQPAPGGRQVYVAWLDPLPEQER